MVCQSVSLLQLLNNILHTGLDILIQYNFPAIFELYMNTVEVGHGQLTMFKCWLSC